MGKYILKEEYALRRYINNKFCLIRRVEPYINGFENNRTIELYEDEFDFLKSCDGENEQSAEIMTFYSELKDYICPAEEGMKLSDWQKNICHDNHYYKTVGWRITEQCNYSCLHCYAAADEGGSFDVVRYDEALKIIDELSECGVQYVDLTGGEPLLHPDLLAIVRAINDKGMQVGKIQTNGSLITKELLDEIEMINGRTKIEVSFDGFGYHDWMRGCKGAEEEAIRAISLIKEKGFPIMINSQVNRETMKSCRKTIDYFGELGIYNLRFIRTAESLSWARLGGDANLTMDEYNDLMVELAGYFNERPRNIRVLNLWDFGDFFNIEKKYKMANTACLGGKYSDRVPVCVTIKNKFIMSAGGEVYPCNPMSGYCDAMGMSFGNIKNESLQSILRDGYLVKISKMTAGDVRENNEECANCKYFKQCLSGCPVMGMLTSGSFYGKNSNMCALFKGDYESKIREVLPDWENINPIVL